MSKNNNQWDNCLECAKYEIDRLQKELEDKDQKLKWSELVIKSHLSTIEYWKNLNTETIRNFLHTQR